MVLNPQTNSALDIAQNSKNLVFINSDVENYDPLLLGTTPNTEVILLDSSRDGIEQISQILSEQTQISSIHLVSHGQPGKIGLGNTELSLNTLDLYQNQLQDWSEALTPTADIVVYGCNVTVNDDGHNLIAALADLTTADIAASNDLTGSNVLGGDWEWETTTGAIESTSAFTSEAIANFSGVLAAGHSHSEHNNSEHSALLDLVPHDRATHVAIKNGAWFDPNIWHNGQVPGDDADVWIPQEHYVWYGSQSNERLDTVRVDGTLQFASQRNTKMSLDTLVVSPQGRLWIGKENNPIRADKTAEIIFTSEDAIDTTWDSKQLSRGLISSGQVKIYGADKVDFVPLKQDALQGDNELILDLPSGRASALGWRVGDQLVLGGTSYSHQASDEDNARFHDEELTITAIEGDRVRFTNNNIDSGDNTILRFDHKRPDGFADRLNLYVANTTRNVSFATENGDRVPTQQRGHVMLMHNPDVVVQNAGFYHLGRTDKNQLIDDPVKNVDGSKGNGTNPRGRYSLHFHRNGSTEDLNGLAAIAKGNAIVDSPGWGLVHHDGHVVLEDNVVFDVVGSGIAAEAGNEIGAWRNNITIKTTGDDDPGLGFNGPREYLFDFGFNGEGYWVQGAAQVEMENNIAISAASAGITLFGFDGGSEQFREAQTISVATLPEQWQDIAKGTQDETQIDVSVVPLRKLSGFESYNATVGILSWGRMDNQDGQLDFFVDTNGNQRPSHNFRSVIDDFQVWNIVGNGINLAYSSNIDLQDGLILGKPQRGNSTGITSNDRSTNLHYQNIHVENWVNGVKTPYDADKDFVGSGIKDSYFANNQNNFVATSSSKQAQEDFPAFFQIGDRNVFQTDSDNLAPRPRFNTETIGGLAVDFDASASFDRDSSLRTKASQGIVSYGWDFDHDGQIDRFGRQVSHHFARAGSYDVSLQVWDEGGASRILTKTINVKQKNYQNAWINGNFSSSQPFTSHWNSNSKFADRGWFASTGVKHNSSLGNGGAVTLSGSEKRSVLGQVVFDQNRRRGSQTLSLDLKNIEGDLRAFQLNEITINLWGIDGEFYNNPNPYTDYGPYQAGALPMKSEKLVEQTVGGSSFDWREFQWDVDLQDGYQFLLLEIVTNQTNHSKDLVAIDNIQLK